MIQIVMKPVPGAGMVNRENLYAVLFNGEDVGLKVRGRKAAHAEEKLMVIFREQLNGKTIDYDLEAYKEGKGESEEEKPDARMSEADLPGMEMS